MIKFLKTNNKNNFYKEEIELSQLANLYGDMIFLTISVCITQILMRNI